jgi:hypothetical protein
MHDKFARSIKAFNLRFAAINIMIFPFALSLSKGEWKNPRQLS